MKIKNSSITVLILFFVFTSTAYSKSFPLNKVGCFIVNENFFPNQPTILKSNIINLSRDTTKIQSLYHNKNITMEIKSSTVINAELKRPWISSFELVLLKNNSQINIRSQARNSEKDPMSIHVTMSKVVQSEKTGKLTIECNARE